MAEKKMSYAEVAGLYLMISDDELTLAESEMSEENTDVTMAVGEISDEETYQELIEKEMCEEKTESTLENEVKTDIAVENKEIFEETLENMEMCEEKTELSNKEKVVEKTELALENKETVDENPGSTLSENDISVKFKVILTEKELSEINPESAENVSEELSSLPERWSAKLGKNSVPKQLAAGGVGGLVIGYLAGKAPKSAAVGLLGSLLLLRIAQHKGHLKKEIKEEGETVKETERATSKSGHCPFQDFAAENVYVTGGFAGGLLVGIASSWKC